jgi:hypothetical protein
MCAIADAKSIAFAAIRDILQALSGSALGV